MSTPDYTKLGFTAIRVELDNSVAVVTLARSKQSVRISVIIINRADIVIIQQAQHVLR